jgi:hypothetical protein
LTPGIWFDNYIASKVDHPQRLRRSQRANKKRKDNSQKASLTSNLNRERNLQKIQQFKRRSLQLQRQAKREFTEGNKKAKIASNAAVNSRSPRKNQFNTPQASLDHITYSSEKSLAFT